MIAFVCASGWGFNNYFWHYLSASLSKHGHVCYVDSLMDSAACERLIKSASSIVGIGHSLGVHKLSKIGCNAVVALQSFEDFLGYSDRIRIVRERFLEDMIMEYHTNPRLCEESFVQRCLAVSNLSIEDVSKYVASGDEQEKFLQLLSLRRVFDITWLDQIPLLCIYTADDPIVPARIASQSFLSHSVSQRVCINSDGNDRIARHHALGFWQSDTVYELIMDFLFSYRVMK